MLVYLCGTYVQIRRKLVIVGDGAAGKTSLLNVFAVGHFPESYVSWVVGCGGALAKHSHSFMYSVYLLYFAPNTISPSDHSYPRPTFVPTGAYGVRQLCDRDRAGCKACTIGIMGYCVSRISDWLVASMDDG